MPSAVERRVPGRFHSRFVWLLKVVLPGAALALAVLFFVWPYWQSDERNFRIRPIKIAAQDLENLNVVGARFVGLDGNDQPFTVMADQAVQENADDTATELVAPRGDITLKDGTWLAVTAGHGRYFREAKSLELIGDVTLFQDNGYEVHTEAATIDLAKGSASGEMPVRGQGPGLQLEGAGFQLLDRGKRVIIRGQSRLVIAPTSSPPKVAR